MQLSTARNGLTVNYDQQKSIVIAMQCMDHDAETIIRILPQRVRVSSKYEIFNDQLTEDGGKPSTGQIKQTAPESNIHILIRMETFDDTVARIEVNGVFYLLFWRTQPFGTHTRKAVTVVTEHGYRSMKDFYERRPKMSWSDYFFGPKITPEPVANVKVEVADKKTKNDAPETIAKIAHDVTKDIVNAVTRRIAPDASVLTQYGFQRYFQTKITSGTGVNLEEDDNDSTGTVDLDSVKKEEAGQSDGSDVN